jgi:hypothetical protein
MITRQKPSAILATSGSCPVALKMPFVLSNTAKQGSADNEMIMVPVIKKHNVNLTNVCRSNWATELPQNPLRRIKGGGCGWFRIDELGRCTDELTPSK